MKHLLLVLLLLSARAVRADEVPLVAAIRALAPTAVPMVDFELRDDADAKGPRLVRWNEAKLGARPTEAQLAAARLALAGPLAAMAQMRAALLAEYRALSVGEQTLYAPTLEALSGLFSRTDLTAAQKAQAAREVITLAPVPTEPLAAARLRMLALLPQ